jgi:hypothetical protein
MPIMLHIITGYFNTRREAELTVEHLVQDHGLDRRLVQAMAEADLNTSGTVVSGADAADAASGEVPEGVRQGRIMVKVEVESGLLETALASFRECGATEVETTSPM